MTITVLREPLHSYIQGLETFKFTVSSSGRIEPNGGMSLYGLPTFDHEDAMMLAAEMNAVVRPILARFAAQKIEEFLPNAHLARSIGEKS